MSKESLQGDGTTAGDETETRTLTAELEVLREENRRLRQEYSRARKAEYGRAGAMLATLGGITVASGVLYPPARTVLFALGGTGVFLAVLLYYLTPEQFVPATIGESIYATLADNERAMVDELGLTDHRVYVPTDDGSVRLFVPQHTEYTVPETPQLDDTFVVEDPSARGIAIEPTGNPLYETFADVERHHDADGPAAICERLREALVEQFELVGDSRVDVGAGQATVGVTDSRYGRVDRIDHPVTSLFAVGIARETGHVVTAETETPDDDRFDYLVTCSWDEA